MEKKITLNEWNYIGKYNPGAKWIRPFCSYTIKEIAGGDYIRQIKIGWFGYLLMFIPVHIFKVFWCLWDGGLKEFEIEGRNLGYDELYYGSEFWERAKEILER